MNTRDILAVLVLICLVANVADWLFTGRLGFYHFPRSGKWLFVLKIGGMLLAVFAILSLLSVLPAVYFAGIGTAYFAILQGYAIFCRHSQKRVTL